MTPLREALPRRVLALVLALGVLVVQTGLAQAQAERLRFIRDAEIEGLMRLYTRPIFKVAGINPGSVHVYLIDHPSINAFVAGGQRIFIHTGLLSKARTPNEVIGVLAHETAHIAGAHLSRMGNQIDKASTLAIATMLLGAAASIGAGLGGQKEAAKAGQGIMLGGQSLAQRLVLSYARAQESAADQAAVRYLDQIGQSGKGMLDLFYKLANQSLASINNVDPYVLSHPMPFERIRNLEVIAKKSKSFGKADSEALVLRHQLMQAKLDGFQTSARAVFQKYPASDASLPARYARAIATFRVGDTRNAIPIIDSLIRDIPQNPYFWELKGQALLEGGDPAAAISPLRKAVSLLPKNGLLLMLLARAELNGGNPQQALKTLKAAERDEGDHPEVHSMLASAYGKLGDVPMAELETAEAALLSGDRDLAVQKAKSAAKRLKKNSPGWLRANDILNYAANNKG